VEDNTKTDFEYRLFRRELDSTGSGQSSMSHLRDDGKEPTGCTKTRSSFPK